MTETETAIATIAAPAFVLFCRKVLREKQAERFSYKHEGRQKRFLVDVVTAQLVVSVWDHMSEQNKAKSLAFLNKHGAAGLAALFWKATSK